MIEVTVINGFGRRSFPIIVGHMVDGSTNLPSTGGTSVDRNLLKPGTWQLNTLGSQVGFLELATSGAGGSNAIVLAEQPDGSNGIVWRATSGTGALQQGGWETSPQYVVDPTKMYRSIVWVKVTGSAINGSYYHGPWVAGVNDMGGALNTNPYFQGGNRNTLPAGVWVLLVGYIYPASYAGAQANKGGVYRSDTGAKLSASPDYRWAASAAQGAHRAYQYYSSGAVGTNYQEFWGPRVELVDGNEQSIGSILASSALAAAAAAQATADGKIDSYWQAAPPGLASEGDLWFDTDDGLKQYRWTSGAWVVAADTRIGSAIANAATAQSTANQKIVSFVQAAPPTATSIGDLWFDLDDSFKLYRWNGSSWAVSSDTRIEIALTTAAAAQATADGKIDSFWQITAPATASEGDLWFDTDDNLKQYRWTSGAWVIAADTRIGAAILSAATAQATADGKIVSFVQASAPTATAVGDLWFDSDDGYKLYRWNGSWVAYQFDTGAIASGAATLVTSTTASALAIAGVISADTYTDITSTTFVSPITGHAHIVANGSFTYTTAGGESNIEFTTGLKVNGSAVVASGRTHIQASPGTGVVTRGTFTYTIRYPVTAGVTETFVVRGQKLGSGSTLVINNAETRVEVIKL